MKKVLFVGLGSIGRRHLNNFKKILPNTEIGAYRSNKNAYNAYSSKLIDYQFFNCKDAKKFNPELIFVSNPTSLHIETVLNFLDIASGIYIEKPLSDSIDKAKKLIDKSRDYDIFFHVACPLRFHPAIEFIKKYLNNIDDVLNIRITAGSYLPSWRPKKNYKLTYSAKKELGGGVSLDLIHEIDIIRWIFGDINEGYFGSAKISNLEIDVEDSAFGIWKLKNGVMCEIFLDYFRKIPKRELEIVTENCIIIVDLLNSTAKIINENNEKLIYNFPFNRNDMYMKEMNYFLNCNYLNPSFNDLLYAFDTLKYAMFMRKNAGIVKL